MVGTPGRVMDHMRRHTIKTAQVRTVVLDEADEMLNMGFREDIETILKDMPTERQTALFSATMPKPILEITKEYQKPDAQYLKMMPKEVTISLVKQVYYQVSRKDKEEVLTRLLDYYHPKRSLIFCNTKRMVDELTEHLKDRGYQAEGIHGDLSQNQRDTVMNLFRGGRTAVLIATDVAARGIDVDDVEAVFNYDVPEDIEYYVHRIGQSKNLDKTVEFLEGKLAEGEYTALELAAAFMKMKMGDDIKDIKVEKSKIKEFGLRRGGADGKRGEGRRRGERGRGKKKDILPHYGERPEKAARGEKLSRREKEGREESSKRNSEKKRGSRRMELGIRSGKEGKAGKGFGKRKK